MSLFGTLGATFRNVVESLHLVTFRNVGWGGRCFGMLQGGLIGLDEV